MAADAETERGSEGKLLEELLDLDNEQEEKILNKILEKGFDQGCLIRPPAEALLSSPAECEALLEGLESRDKQEATADDPFLDEDIPHKEIAGDQPAYVVLTQRCDLIRGFREEPVVELARATLVAKDSQLRTMAKRNSPRYLFLCDVAEASWIVDLRSRALLPKHRLTECDPAPLVIEPGLPRRDFQLRLGQRYSRDAVPDDIVQDLQRPLADWFSKSTAQRRHGDMFSVFFVQRQPEGLLLAGVIGHGHDPIEANKAFKEMLSNLETNATLHPLSSAYSTKDVPLSMYLESYKLSLDELSRSSKAGDDAAQPLR
jgi:hypothetical protein